MARSTDDVKNWVHLFRWIVKLIRDDYGIEESRLTRRAALEGDLCLSIEQVEQVMEIIEDSFGIRYPDGTLDGVLRLEELCMLTAWLKALYKRPDFISDDFEARCRALNAAAA